MWRLKLTTICYCVFKTKGYLQLKKYWRQAKPDSSNVIIFKLTSFWNLMVCLDTAYFVKNWKYCNKIIFKYVNTAVRAIFKKNFVEKRGLWVPWILHGTHWKSTTATKRTTKKKKQNRRRVIIGIQMDT